MKRVPALLVMSSLVWAGVVGAPAALAGKNSNEHVPLTQDKFDTSPEKFKCLERCQKPILQCMSRCGGQQSCAAECHGDKLAQCADSCGMMKKK